MLNKSRKEKWEEVYVGNELPWIHNPTPDLILKKFNKYFKPGDKILDYGCGDGALAKILINNKLDVLCSDISNNALYLAKQKNPNLKVVQASSPVEFCKKKSKV